MNDYYGRDGQPIDQDEWLRRYTAEEKRVAQTTVEEADVSTVWLGLDHCFGDGPPLIFETMIFGGEHGENQWRYSTEEAAKAHHAALVEALRNGTELPDAT